MSNLYPYTYEAAAKYLSKGKDKQQRPLDGSKTKRIGWCGDGKVGEDSIALRLHNTDCVLMHPDGTFTINSDGWKSQITQRFIAQYSPAKVFVRSHKWWISDKNNSVTPPKVWKCRTCSGTGGGPRMSYGEYRGANYTNWISFPEPVRIERGCYRCNGTGRADYGSKPVYTAWDGTPLLIAADGNVIGPDGTNHKSFYWWPTAKPYWSKPAGLYVPTQTYASTSTYNVPSTLSTLLPDLGVHVKCPADTGMVSCVQAHAESIQSRIVHLNDFHEWPREEIADWLDTLDVDLRFNAA